MKTESSSYNKTRILLKNLKNLLILILVPLLLLGSISILITQGYIKNEVNQNNAILLKQASEQMEMIVNELETLSLNFSVNPNAIVPLKRIFNESSLSYEDENVLTLIKSYIESSSHVKPYIHSISIYYQNNNNRLISSIGMGLVNVNNSFDDTWFDSYMNNRSAEQVWSEVRYLLKDSPDNQHVLTLYKNLFTSGPANSDGVIMLNIKIDYIEQILSGVLKYPEQGLVVVNEQGIPIVTYNIPASIQNRDIADYVKDSRSFFSTTSSHSAYTVSKYDTPQYGWEYLSITPNDVLYQVPMRLLGISVALLIGMLGLGVLLAVYETRSNFISFAKIIHILNSAKEGEILPPVISRVKDEHGFIIQTIVKSFIEQNYLKVQLSERQYRMKVLELLALQAQINPHFLYNTLHTISWKSIALTSKPNEVSAMIENLATILKYSLSNANQTVSLEEEIYYTKCYLDIQSVRYRNQFEVRWQYGEDIKQLRIMKLLLQPLIENSIYHGIKEKEEPGLIRIRIARDNSDLKIWLTDDGLGILPERLQQIRTLLKDKEEHRHQEHIGLFNVYKRLALTYGDDFSMRIKSIYRSGTAIYIRIPAAGQFELEGGSIEQYRGVLAQHSLGGT